jgi:hypothetical protein
MNGTFPAFGARLGCRIRELLLNHLETLPAGIALVLIKRHGYSSSNASEGSCKSSRRCAQKGADPCDSTAS